MSNLQPASLLRGKRFYIVLFLFFNVSINYVDRVNLSVAAPIISKYFHWDAAMMGWVFSAYLWTYTALLVPSGWLGDRIGVRRTAAIAISVWSVAAMLTGAVSSFFSMILTRLGLGLGEAASFPMCNNVVRQWFPAEERGFATGLFHAGVFVSTALATPAVAWTVLRYGWRASFVIFGSLGFVWLILWLKCFHPPETCPWLPEDERSLILANRERSSKGQGTSASARRLGFFEALAPLLRQKTTWGMFISQGCVNYMQYLFLAWLPSYLVQARGMNLMKAGIYTAIPYLVGTVVEVTLGKASDHMYTPEELKQGKRRNLVAILLVLTSVVLLINVVDSSFAIIAIITMALSCNTSVIMFNYALTNDLVEDPQVAGTAFGILQLGGNSFGLCAPIFTGYIVKTTGSFSSAFALAGALALIGAGVAFTMTRRPIHGSLPDGVAVPVVTGQ
jgi:ACS family glucarate transporter-like MFS transporter